MDKLIAKNSRFTPAFLLRAYYFELKNDLPAAINSYQKTLELSPDNPIAANNLAWL